MTDANRERGYTITSVFDAPRELVWDAWTTPEQFAVWFGGEPARMENMQMDVRPNGRWSGTMVLPDGNTIDWQGWFVELDRPAHLAMTLADREIIGDAYEIYTVTLTDLGGKTEMVLRQHGGNLSDDEYERAKEGTSAFLDAMAAMLTSR